jgi:hypothetical protein
MDAQQPKERGEGRKFIARWTVYWNAEAATSGIANHAAVSHARGRSAGAGDGKKCEARQGNGIGDYFDGPGSPRAVVALATTPR